jgi:hypothetical protein
MSSKEFDKNAHTTKKKMNGQSPLSILKEKNCNYQNSLLEKQMQSLNKRKRTEIYSLKTIMKMMMKNTDLLMLIKIQLEIYNKALEIEFKVEE